MVNSLLISRQEKAAANKCPRSLAEKHLASNQGDAGSNPVEGSKGTGTMKLHEMAYSPKRQLKAILHENYKNTMVFLDTYIPREEGVHVKEFETHPSADRAIEETNKAYPGLIFLTFMKRSNKNLNLLHVRVFSVKLIKPQYKNQAKALAARQKTLYNSALELIRENQGLLND